ncbi:MAG TPA: hypothetical protein VJV78_11575 [Polyangiales bacterium]|nr:hypothetical protein [Polyangiales bacterium]
MRNVFACVLVLATLLPGARALACGVSGPDGVWSCSLEEHEEEIRPRWQLGAAGMYTSTALRFDDLRAEQRRWAVLATGAYAPTRRLSFQLSAGVGLGGELRVDDAPYEFSAGPNVAAGVAYTLLEGQLPFVVLTGVFSAAFARTQAAGEDAQSYTALDLRVGLTAGVVLFDVLVPYAVVRVFGGPVFWHVDGESRTGTDVHHYQVGAGLMLRPLEWLSISFEGVPLGEQALAAGAAIAF